ncbi:MAG: 4-hydroxythreonine-4-phosphate dehydrogenase PdxA [Verrucomicrobia bacterium]|nr:MAG: 4-hydroxythreonine-4-phosphate dehydrogenase PdxA [Verrucomicrobiota bacterium]
MTIGISLGDIAGIGPEVTLKALAAEAESKDFRFLILGDVEHTMGLNRELGLNLPLRACASNELAPRPGASGRRAGTRLSPPLISVCNPLSQPLPSGMPAGAAAASQAAVAWIREGAKRCLSGELEALVTAPVNKAAIIRTGMPFTGQTELLAEMAGCRTVMMLLGHDDRNRWLRVALATTHVPLKRVSESLTQSKIEQTIELAAKACRDLGLPRAKIAVCGLNPHAGEGGALGDEEQTTVIPAVEAARSRGLDVVGPMSADALFYYVFKDDYDAVVAMYHDQGLVPLKMIGFETGVNWTLGLPFIRTSPDHGTAYDIAGQGKANPSSMIAAIELAKQLARRRAVPQP